MENSLGYDWSDNAKKIPIDHRLLWLRSNCVSPTRRASFPLNSGSAVGLVRFTSRLAMFRTAVESSFLTALRSSGRKRNESEIKIEFRRS